MTHSNLRLSADKLDGLDASSERFTRRSTAEISNASFSTREHFDRCGALSTDEKSRRVIRDTLVSHMECGFPARSTTGQQSEKTPRPAPQWRGTRLSGTFVSVRTRTRDDRYAIDSLRSSPNITSTSWHTR